MNKEQFLKNLQVPNNPVDVVIDTDAYNEVDDQFALAYLINSKDKINLKAIYAAPFYNEKSSSPADGMYKSYDEIINILELTNSEQYKKVVYYGSEHYMKDENTPVKSDAAFDLIERARQYSPEKPLYVIGIGAATNIASAIVAAPDIAQNIVIVWLGGHDIHNGEGCREFNMMQDIAAARILFTCDAPLVQLPCGGVVSSFTVSEPEFNYWLKGKNKLCDYLVDIVIKDQKHFAGRPWSRILWDVTAVAWLLNNDYRFMSSKIINCCLPGYDLNYVHEENTKLIQYVKYIKRDALLEDLINKLIQF